MSLSGMVEILRLEAKIAFVMPAQAGIHLRRAARPNESWIPAYAGMTTPKSRPL
jgi:hypothetical protein